MVPNWNPKTKPRDGSAIYERVATDFIEVSCNSPWIDNENCLEHFLAIIYSDKDYDIVRRVAHNKDVYSTRISVKDGEQIYSNFAINSRGMMERKKDYIFASNEDLINKIDSLRMLK